MLVLIFWFTPWKITKIIIPLPEKMMKYPKNYLKAPGNLSQNTPWKSSSTPLYGYKMEQPSSFAKISSLKVSFLIHGRSNLSKHNDFTSSIYSSRDTLKHCWPRFENIVTEILQTLDIISVCERLCFCFLIDNCLFRIYFYVQM